MFFREQVIRQTLRIDPKEKRAGLTYRELLARLDALFEFGEEETRGFFANVFWLTVLDKIRAPEGALSRQWMTPGGWYYGRIAYRAQYTWDTMFMLDVLSYLPSHRDTVREVMGNFWDFQDAWDAAMPAYAQGMIGHGLTPDGHAGHIAHLSPHTCNPIFAWGVERIYRHNGDVQFARESLARLERCHEWYWRERDLDNIGLIGGGSYDGGLQMARDEQGYDFACDTDTLQMIPHPERPDGPAHYGDLYGVAPTSYVIHAERCLARLARELGDEAMAVRRQKRIDKGVAAMRAHMWDDRAGTFLTIRRGGEKIRTVAIGSWMPLLAGAPTPEQADRMISILSTPEWMTPLPVPTVGRTDPLWEPGHMSFLPYPPKRRCSLSGLPYNMWRGDVWPPTNYQIAAGLKAYGAAEPAARITDATIMNAIMWGDVNERYDCDTGRPLGVSDYGMSACVIAMVLDGLTCRYTAKERGVVAKSR